MMRLPFMKHSQSSNTMVILSELGKRIVLSRGEQGRNYQILVVLESNGGSMTISQIAQKFGISPEETKHRLKILRGGGYVRFAGEDNTFPMNDE